MTAIEDAVRGVLARASTVAAMYDARENAERAQREAETGPDLVTMARMAEVNDHQSVLSTGYTTAELARWQMDRDAALETRRADALAELAKVDPDAAARIAPGLARHEHEPEPDHVIARADQTRDAWLACLAGVQRRFELAPSRGVDASPPGSGRRPGAGRGRARRPGRRRGVACGALRRLLRLPRPGTGHRAA